MLHDCFAEVDGLYPGLNKYRRRHEALRRFFGILVEDVISVARRNLAELDPQDVTDIRGAGRMMVQFTPALWSDLKVIRAFLFERMYRAPSVIKMRRKVTGVVNDLFPLFLHQPDLLPKRWREDVASAESEEALARIVADYISGMTDRFALQSHKRFIG